MKLLVLIFSLATCLSAQAFSIDKPVALSKIGEPLEVEIKVQETLRGELSNYRFNISPAESHMNLGYGWTPVHSIMNVTVLRRYGQTFLRIHSSERVGAERLNVVLNAESANGRMFEELQLYFQPNHKQGNSLYHNDRMSDFNSGLHRPR